MSVLTPVAATVPATMHAPAAIHVLLQQLADSLNQQCWQTLAQCFSADALLVNLLGDRAEGTGAILQYQQGIAALFPDRLVHYLLLSCQPIAQGLYLLNVQQQWLCRQRRQPQGVSSCPLFVVRLQHQQAHIIGCNSL